MPISAGDTAWMLGATALVFFMMPGLALFYGGLVGVRNVIDTMAQSFVAIGVISVLWIVIGYSLAFGPDHSGVVGGLQYFMLRGIGTQPSSFAPTIPPLLFMAFQMKFAVITPALIAGAFVGAHALPRLPRLHRPLVAARLLPLRALGVGRRLPRRGRAARRRLRGRVRRARARRSLGAGDGDLPREEARPTSIRTTCRSCCSAPGSCGSAGSASTRAAPEARARSRCRHSSTPRSGPAPGCSPGWPSSGCGAASPRASASRAGAVAGLAAITPASGYVPTWAALIIGGAAGLLCYLAVELKDALALRRRPRRGRRAHGRWLRSASSSPASSQASP